MISTSVFVKIYYLCLSQLTENYLPNFFPSCSERIIISTTKKLLKLIISIWGIVFVVPRSFFVIRLKLINRNFNYLSLLSINKRSLE